MNPNPAAKVDTGPQVCAIGHKELEHQAIHYSYLDPWGTPDLDTTLPLYPDVRPSSPEAPPAVELKDDQCLGFQTSPSLLLHIVSGFL